MHRFSCSVYIHTSPLSSSHKGVAREGAANLPLSLYCTTVAKAGPEGTILAISDTFTSLAVMKHHLTSVSLVTRSKAQVAALPTHV